MLPLLAETPTNAAEWLDNLQFVFTLILGAAGVWAVLSNRTQKREVSFADEFARKEDFVRLQSEVEDLDAKVETINTHIAEMERRVTEAGEKRAGAIHDRISVLVDHVAEIRGVLKARGKDHHD